MSNVTRAKQKQLTLGIDYNSSTWVFKMYKKKKKNTKNKFLIFDKSEITQLDGDYLFYV